MTENIQPLPPYKGTEPYIFISYSHINQPQALEMVKRLQKEGYRVWYDEGIDPGTEWDDNIAEHVLSCGYFVALISENYLASENCKDELNLAREENKPRLLVYLENVTLPAGMRMRLNRLQAIHKYKYQNEDTFIEKFKETRGIGDCFDPAALPKREEPALKTPVPIAAPQTPQAPADKPLLKKESPVQSDAPASVPESAAISAPISAPAEPAEPAEPAKSAAPAKPAVPVTLTTPTAPATSAKSAQDSHDNGKDEPFVFLSYSHRDRQEVFSLVKHLREAGIKVFFDEGIEVGSEWVSHITKHLEACAHFMPLITPNFAVSEVCRQELNYATTLKKKILPLYLENFELPAGIELQLSIYPGVRRADFVGENDFLDAVSSLLLLKNCKKTVPAPQNESKPKIQAPKKQEPAQRAQRSPQGTSPVPEPMEQTLAKWVKGMGETDTVQSKPKTQAPSFSAENKEKQWADFFAHGAALQIDPPYKELNLKPHIFVDFVPEDESKAKCIIKELREQGYRVAYTTKGGLFKKVNIKDQVYKATVFLPLISENYLKKRGDQLGSLCGRFGVHDCLLYLERCQLPQELRLRFAAKDNLKIYNYQYPRNFFTALYNTNNVRRCK